MSLYVPPSIDVSSPLNLLSADDAGFKSGIGTAVGTNATLAQNTSVTLGNADSLAVTATAAGAFSVALGPYPVTAGVAYYALASSKAAATAETFSASLQWLNSSGGVISTTAGTGLADSTSNWTQATVSGVAPAGAVNAKIIAGWANAAASEVHYVSQVALYQSAAPVNLVPDTSDLHTWLSEGDAATIAPSPLGGNQFQVLGTGTAPGGYMQTQAFPVVAGSTYTLSGYIDATYVTSASPLFVAFTLNASGGVNSSIGSGALATPGQKGVWTDTITIPAGVSEIVILAHNGIAVIASGEYLIFSQPQLVLGSTAPAYTAGMNWDNPGSATPWKRFLSGIAPQSGSYRRLRT